MTRAGGALVVQAGTATSTRVREEAQSFNVIEIAAGKMSLALMRWTGGGFEAGTPTQFVRDADGWSQASQAAANAESPV